MKMRSRNGRFATGLIIGSLAGAAAGMMFAPRPGRETRDAVRRQTDHYVGTLRERFKRNSSASRLQDRTDARVEVSGFRSHDGKAIMFIPNHSRKRDKGTRSANSHTLAEFAENSPNRRARGIFPQALVSSMKSFMDLMVVGLAPGIRNERRSYDLVVVGGGRSGLTAALYAGRAGINTLLIDRAETSGRSGRLKCVDHCSEVPVRFDMRLLPGTAVIDIRSKAGCLAVITEDGDEYCTRAVLLATGARADPGPLDTEQDGLAEEGGDIIQAEPNTCFLHGVVELDNHGFIKTGENLDTSLQGVFAAGQARTGFAENEADAEEDGATAAWIIREYLGRHGIGRHRGKTNVANLPAIRASKH